MKNIKKIDVLEKRGRTLLFIETGGDLFAAIAKIIMGIISNSSALIAGGLQSVADTTNQIFLFIGTRTSKKPADESHPFGYGKERFFWALLSAFFIMVFSGGVAFYRGVEKIINPVEITDFKASFILLGIVTLASLFNLFFSSRNYYYLAGRTLNIKVWIKKIKLVKKPEAINLWLGDIATFSSNVLVGISLVLVYTTNNTIYDGISSIIIGAGLIGLGIFLAKDTKNLLIGEAVTPAMYEQIARIIRSFPEVNELIKLKTMHLTPVNILINADVNFADNLDTEDIERSIDAIEEKLKKEIPAVKQISIEAEE